MVLNCYTEAFDFASPSPGPEELAVVEVGNFPGSWVASYSAQMAGSREDSVYPGSIKLHATQPLFTLVKIQLAEYMKDSQLSHKF